MKTLETIPCIEDKCITYPICRNHKIICCPVLNKIMSKLDDDTMQSQCVWPHINKFFPNLHTVYGETDKVSFVNGPEAVRLAIKKELSR